MKAEILSCSLRSTRLLTQGLLGEGKEEGKCYEVPILADLSRTSEGGWPRAGRNSLNGEEKTRPSGKGSGSYKVKEARRGHRLAKCSRRGGRE